MKRQLVSLLFVSLTVIALALGGWLHTARADNASIDWDIGVVDNTPNSSDPVCPSNSDGIAQVGECPEMTGHFDIGTVGTSMSFFDMATEFMATSGLGTDLDGDGLPDGAAGVAKLSNEARGSTVGTVEFTLKGNVVLANLLNNNIDDTVVDADNTVLGQPARCNLGTDPGNPTTGFAPLPFYLWAADKTQAKFVPYLDTGGIATIPQTQEDNYSAGDDCTAGPSSGPNGIPDAIDCTPSAMPTIEAALGYPIGNYVDRFYGIANLPVGSPVPVAYSPVDVQFLYYNMVADPMIQGYVQIAVVNYPGLPVASPIVGGYDPKPQQTVLTCSPYTTNVKMYGASQNSDFSVMGGTNPYVVAHNKVRTVTGAGTFDYLENKSTMEDWDNDGLGAITNSGFDRCQIDPASGTAAQDTDKDFLTGLCETLGLGNTEGVNGKVGNWNTAPPWDTGQDVDADGFINESDNCPIIADRDLGGTAAIDYQQDTDADGVGDVCEKDLASGQGWPSNAYLIPGNGLGYPGSPAIGDMYTATAPGYFNDRDNVCSDPITYAASGGSPETAFDAGRWCAGVDAIANARGTDPNPPQVLGQQFADSNDNATMDLLDLPAGDPIEYMDSSDTDFDGHTDACEAFLGSDPLDASSVPAYHSVTPLAGDCDSDGTPDASDADPFDPGVQLAGAAGAAPSSPQGTETGMNPDADHDGCTRNEELPDAPAPKPGSTAAESNGGTVAFSDMVKYDFYDVPVPSLKVGAGTYNGAVTMGDVLAVLSYVGERYSPPTAAYVADVNGKYGIDGPEYDRSPSPDPNRPWDAGPANGSVAMSDVLAALVQVGLSCSGHR